MYKYTYLLSQTYRTDTSQPLPHNYQSIQQGSNYVHNTVLHGKINPRGVNISASTLNHKEKQYRGNNTIQTIGDKYKLGGRDIEKVRQVNDRLYNKKQVRNDFDIKIKEIAEKYSHKANPLKECSNQPIKQKQNFQYKPLHTQNKSYLEYKSQKNNPYNKTLHKYETATKDQQSRSQQKKVNTLNEEQNKNIPLRQANINRLIAYQNQQQNNVNRTRIKSQIDNYMQSKGNRQHMSGISKKYHYHIDKQRQQVPVNDKVKNYQQGQTITKLSSLQSKIKSLVGQNLK